MNVIMELTTGDSNGKKITPEMVKKLGLPKEVTDLITDSYKYGKMTAVSGKSLENMPEKDVNKMIRDLQLTPAQKRGIEYAQMNAKAHLDTLEAKIKATVTNLAIQENQNMYNAIKDVVPEAIRNNTERYKVVQQLRETSGDWERDWYRVAHTEMWNAKCNGEVNAIMHGESPLSSDGGDTLVFKRPRPDACPACKKAYLEKGTMKPKVFKLSELLANGTNYGLKQADWKPVVGTLHPNCMCPLSILPKGFTLDDAGNMIKEDTVSKNVKS